LPDAPPACPCHAQGVKQTPIYTEKEKKMMGQQRAVAEQTGSALKRIVLVLAVAAVMAAMMVIMASPAFAASTKGNNVGQQTSQANQKDPGLGGQGVREAAQEEEGGLGDIARNGHSQS
jgi:hypothetical protein